jgi:hypothetical protein
MLPTFCNRVYFFNGCTRKKQQTAYKNFYLTAQFINDFDKLLKTNLMKGSLYILLAMFSIISCKTEKKEKHFMKKERN